ncbi:tol-pal system-associated acyl-CoA thioesterase [Varunaivibrio sulfuroxidans]|uniref:Acyl-CoA thioester hydrolase n=1 Tax=Varunaivibrio sulfuroxidans TaxID=1773489 RepID=A0A4R3JB68_9PROT|nr:tol-pal system-associated acyl-CoA thioesterase [Varunaivibrio sulfuroxidans]TCS63148.1 acyl-CoA thioester hydrolase [Varunaivibrio sulfuroxidans]WES31787.1 tol-pal system-associated acyl-CoA thioesterase [Varunaivibrio sulfuroxidans]
MTKTLNKEMSDPRLGARGVFVLPVRVYYEDTDAGGVVYYANYLKFAERARSEMLRRLGIENATLQERHRLTFVVRSVSAQYFKPARLDDLLDVGLRLTKVGGASLEGVQSIRRDGEELVRLEIRLGCMKLDGGPGRMPEAIRRKLQDFIKA